MEQPSQVCVHSLFVCGDPSPNRTAEKKAPHELHPSRLEAIATRNKKLRTGLLAIATNGAIGRYERSKELGSWRPLLLGWRP